MLRDELYAAYTWRVRHFKEGETNETTIRFTPNGRPYGFVERLKEDAPGAALDPAAARRIAEEEATARWACRPRPLRARRAGAGAAHRRTCRPHLHLRAGVAHAQRGRYRVRLVVSGDRLTEVTHFIKVPEAFTRRYAGMRIGQRVIGYGSVAGMAVLYVFAGIGVGLFVMLRQRWVLWRTRRRSGAGPSALLQALTAINEFPLLWMTYDTAVPQGDVHRQPDRDRSSRRFLGFSVFFALSFMAAETLGRRAFGTHPQLWRVWSNRPGQLEDASSASTAAGYLLVAVFFAYDVVLYLVMTRAVRMVVAVGGAAAPGRAGHLRAVALGHRQLAPGGLLGRVRCFARCRSPAPLSSATASASGICSS